MAGTVAGAVGFAVNTPSPFSPEASSLVGEVRQYASKVEESAVGAGSPVHGGGALCWVLRGGLTNKVTAEQRPEDNEGTSCVASRRTVLEN